MYQKARMRKTTIEVNESVEGQTIEERIEAMVNNDEPITDGAPVIYTERKDGVMGEYDPRVDKWDIAIDAMDKVTKNRITKRETSIAERQKVLDEMNEKTKPKEEEGKA